MERILNMILRRLVNKGVNSGLRAASQRMGKDPKDTANQRQLDKQGQQSTRGLRQATRMMRRFTKF